MPRQAPSLRWYILVADTEPANADKEVVAEHMGRWFCGTHRQAREVGVPTSSCGSASLNSFPQQLTAIAGVAGSIATTRTLRWTANEGVQ